MAAVFIPGEEESVLPRDLGTYEDDKTSKSLTYMPAYSSVQQENTQENTDENKETMIEKEEVMDMGSECFLLRNLMTKEETQFYMTWGDKQGFEEIPECKRTYRSCTRIMVRAPELAEALFARVRPYLDDITIDGDPHQVHVHGMKELLKGKWVPNKINNIFRLCRYEAGGHFAPHFDGHFLESSNVRSMKTIMLYLNGDFTGGHTRFVDESQELYQDENGRYCAEEKNILCEITPDSGLAIIFNHHRLHEGQAVTSGWKYILRSDVMYERLGESNMEPKEEQALSLVQEAERLEALGDCLAAAELYRKAFKLSPSLASYYGN